MASHLAAAAVAVSSSSPLFSPSSSRPLIRRHAPPSFVSRRTRGRSQPAAAAAESSGSPFLEVRGLTPSVKETGRQQILAGVNLTIREGEIHAIMGKNGSGKSTLTKVNINGRAPLRTGNCNSSEILLVGLLGLFTNINWSMLSSYQAVYVLVPETMSSASLTTSLASSSPPDAAQVVPVTTTELLVMAPAKCSTLGPCQGAHVPVSAADIALPFADTDESFHKLAGCHML